jgi:hypothetical protein
LSTGSGDEEHIEWPKIHTPTDEVVVPYDTLDAPPEGVCHDGTTSSSSSSSLSYYSATIPSWI